MALDIVAWGAITFGITAGVQLIFFAIATIFKTDKVTDFSGALGFFILALLGLVWASDYFPRQVVLCSLQMIWAIRLGAYLTTRVVGRKKDERFDEFRAVWWKWLLFWLTQITWIWVVSLPVNFIVSTHENKGLNGADYAGWTVFVVALLIETIADWTKFDFNKKKQPGEIKFISSGLWHYSRHPNYFGEIFVWIGIWISSSNGLWGIETAYGVVGLLSPLLTFILLAFISGIPPTEKRDDKRFGQLPEYYEYKKQTSPLWFFPTSLYRKMPMILRKVPFVDINDYTKLKREEETASGTEQPSQPEQKLLDWGLAGTTFSSEHSNMLPLFKYLLNTTLVAPLFVKYFMNLPINYGQILNILSVATILNVVCAGKLASKCFSAKKWLNGALAFIAGVGFYYLVAVVFGAYVIDAFDRTLTWASWMSSMTALPLGLIFGLEPNAWLDTVIKRNDHGSHDEAKLICGIYSIWAGSWLGSIVIPLDWDRPWQKWPIPNVVGALILCFTTSVGFALKGLWKCCKAKKEERAVSSKIPRRAPKKGTPGKTVAAKASPVKAKASPKPKAAPKTPTRSKIAATRSRSPSKSPQKRSSSPTKSVPSTPKATARSPSKVATPSAARSSSRLAKRSHD